VGGNKKQFPSYYLQIVKNHLKEHAPTGSPFFEK
jgi:hypothetical protein